MGQYYRPVMESGQDVVVFNRDVAGRHTLAKLMEHSWWDDRMVAAVMYQIAKNGIVRIAWVGDYAHGYVPQIGIEAEKVWEDAGEGLPGEYLKPDGAFLVNHDQKSFIDFDSYQKRVREYSGVDDSVPWYIIHPLPLLTAFGNGGGGGDFFEGNLGYDSVGSWCGDLVSVEGIPPAGYQEECVIFVEGPEPL